MPLRFWILQKQISAVFSFSWNIFKWKSHSRINTMFNISHFLFFSFVNEDYRIWYYESSVVLHILILRNYFENIAINKTSFHSKYSTTFHFTSIKYRKYISSPNAQWKIYGVNAFHFFHQTFNCWNLLCKVWRKENASSKLRFSKSVDQRKMCCLRKKSKCAEKFIFLQLGGKFKFQWSEHKINNNKSVEKLLCSSNFESWNHHSASAYWNIKHTIFIWQNY